MFTRISKSWLKLLSVVGVLRSSEVLLTTPKSNNQRKLEALHRDIDLLTPCTPRPHAAALRRR